MPPDPVALGKSPWLRLTVEHVTARALLRSRNLADAAPKILEAICEFFSWEHGALWIVDRQANVLRCVEIWTAGGAAFPEFDAVSRSSAFPPGVGLPGRVWATREPAWILDVVRDSNFPRAPVAAREGLHAGLGFPILLDDDVHGVMEFFSSEIREPDESLLTLLGTIGSQIGLFLDRNRAQEELDRFFRVSPDLMCIAGYDGYFKRVNKAWERVLGYSQEELLTRPYIDLVHPDDRESTANAAQQLSEGRDVFQFENRYMHKDGTYRWLLWMAVTVPEQQAVYATARDITERKASDETLAQLIEELEVARRRAEEATEAKGAFLANMSHEIRTPLNAVLGMTALALQTRLSADQREYLTAVQVAGNSLLEIVNDVLDFSKIEAKRLELEHNEFDLRETVGDAARMLAPRAGEKGIELACHISPEAPDVVVGDPGRLRQVLLNVVGNAVKFTSQGEVVVDVAVDSVTEDAVVLRFTVRDTGIGIPPEKQLQIFHAFTQVDSSTTRRYGGTGLGLAIALRLVELMHGRMWLDSEPGRGSTFHFTAAFERSTAPAVKGRTSGPEALDGLRVLVVDDNATNRVILEEMLASWHMHPTAVGDAESALAALRDADAAGARFDVVVSDCQMPDVDGFTLAKRIKHDARLAKTPFVMLTSMAHADDAARCRKIGIETCLTKPVKHSDLLDALATLFDVSTRRARPAAAPAKPSAVAKRKLRVLVAEDNTVNRKLVLTLLRRRGHEVTTVENGREAVAALQSPRAGGFDVVLMDLQMPEMGGFEATQVIRDSERPGGRRMPIIALTAHAMQGDRERCLEAGMDGYVSKPIDVNELIAAVERFGAPARRRAEPVVPGQEKPLEPVVFDEAAALAHTDHDRALLGSLVKMFREERQGSIASIERAVKSRDAEALRMAAHAVKSPLATLGATSCAAVAAELEQMGRSKTLDGAEEALARLRSGLEKLDDAFVAAGIVKQPRKAAPARNRAPTRAARGRSRS
jgi:two-component system sensor histidine kinase/response regulator